MITLIFTLACGAGVDTGIDPDAGPAPLDAALDAEIDTSSDTPSDTSSESETDPIVTCPNGTCDADEDTLSCPIDCPAVWTECMTPPDDATACEAVCSARGLFCVDVCSSDLDAEPHGMETCSDGGVSRRTAGCGEAFEFPEEWGRCCCGRSAT